MTLLRRRQAAEYFRRLLDDGEHRKEALRRTMAQFRISRATVYNYCRRFGISTS